MSVTCLVGGQYGSEGKGVIAHHLANRFDVHVRVGGPNAGHTFVHEGRKWKMRAVPCGWTNKEAKLIIGRGAVVDLGVLIREVTETGCVDRLVLDLDAAVIDESHRVQERAWHFGDNIGSTQEGVGASRMMRLARHSMQLLVRSRVTEVVCADTVELINGELRYDREVLIEGTQGFGLSLYHGDYPFVTSADTTPAQLLADVGVGPRHLSEVILVIRTYPIRVGGNSGPLPHEISWETLSERIGRKVEEFTTVTGRLRRVAEFDEDLVQRAIQVCQPSAIALMFLDYLYPETEGVRSFAQLSAISQEFVFDLQHRLGVFIKYVGTGGPEFAVIERPV